MTRKGFDIPGVVLTRATQLLLLHISAISTALVLVVCLTSCAINQYPTDNQPKTAHESVILIHGFGRSNMAMWLLASRLEDAGFSVHRVGYDSYDTSMGEIVNNVADQISAHYQANPGTIHFIGHSFGGLLIRSYLQDHVIPTLGRTVLIGTPNQGTPLADRVQGNWLFEAFNSPAEELGTHSSSFPNSLEDPYYQVGIIAGKVNSCIGDILIQESNDGLVPVTSTAVNNMVDFIVVDVSHSFLRYDRSVAKQTIHFLKNGFFYR